LGEEMAILDNHDDIPEQTRQFSGKNKKMIRILNSAVSGRIKGGQGSIRSSMTGTSYCALLTSQSHRSRPAHHRRAGRGYT